MIAIDVSKQQALDADQKAIQQINFTGNLDLDEGAIIFSLLQKQKNILIYLKGNMKVLLNTKYKYSILSIFMLFTTIKDSTKLVT